MVATHSSAEADLFGGYGLTGYDEMFAGPEAPRAHYEALHHRLGEMGADELERRHRVADLMMRQQGITFTVYGREAGGRADHPVRPGPAPGGRRRVGRRSSAV